MAAGMHDAWGLARHRAAPVASWIGSASISARRPTRAVGGAARERGDDAVAADVGGVGNAEFGQLFADEGGGGGFLERELRVGVQVMAPGGELFGKVEGHEGGPNTGCGLV